MKFENIKVGDCVSAAVEINGIGWGERETFYLSRPVVKVTDKRFMVDGFQYQFKKEDGKAVTSKHFVEPVKHLRDRPSQMIEANNYKKRIASILKIEQILDSREIDYKAIRALNSEMATSAFSELTNVFLKYGLSRE